MTLSDAQKTAVRKQIEFYFSDSNLPFDKFLFEQATDAEDGWLDLSVIVAFKRMQQILKKEAKGPDDVPSEDVEAVAAELKASEVVEISEDGFQIRRKDMPKDWEPIKAAVAQRSVHAAPFRCTETIESVGTLFSAHGAVNQVRLQRNPDANGKGSHFAGSVIVEMATQAAADALLAATLERHGATLRLQSKSDYLKALSEAGRAENEPDRSHCPVVTAEGLPEDQPAEAKGEGAEASTAPAEEPYDEGCFVAFTVVGDLPEGMPVGGKLREVLGATGGLKFVDFDTRKDATKGRLRFEAKEHADKCLAEGDDGGERKFELPDDAGAFTIQMTALTGDEEKAAWREYRKNVAARDARDGGGRGPQKRRGSFGGGGRGKRGRS